MPATVHSLGHGRYRVTTPNGVHAKNTSLGNAMAQKRLLNAIDHGWRPTRRSRKSAGLSRYRRKRASHQIG